jgi:uncharacterized delta-60 repeat protein
VESGGRASGQVRGGSGGFFFVRDGMAIRRTQKATRSSAGGWRRRARAAPVERLERRVLLAGQLFITTAATGGGANGTLGEYTTDGATVNAGLVTGLSYSYPYGVAVSGSDVFVSDYYTQTIAEYTTSGAVVNASLLTAADGLTGPFGIAISGSQLYVANGNGGSTTLDGSIGEYTLGSTPGTITSRQPALVTGLADSGFVTVSGSDLFVVDYALGTVGEYTTSGATVNAQLVTGLSNPEGVAVVGSDLFVTEQGSVATIGEYTTSGQVVNAALIPAVAGALSIGASGNDLFVTTNTGQVAEYTTAGGTVNANLIPGLSGAFGMAVVPATGTSSIDPVASAAISAGESFSLDNTAATYSDLGWDLTNQDHSSVTPGGFATNLGPLNFVAPTASTPYFTTTGGVNVAGTTTRQPYLYTTFDDAVQVTAGTPELFTMWIGTDGSTTLDVSLSDGSAAYPATTFTSPTEFQFIVDSATTQDVILSATPAAGVQSGLWAVAASATTTTSTTTANFAGSYTGTVTQTPAGVDSLYDYKLDLQQSGQSVTGTDDVVSSSQPQYYIDYDLSGTVTGDVLNYSDVSVTSENLPAGGVAILKAATLTLATDGLTLQGSWTGDGYTGLIDATDAAKEPKSIGGLDPTFGIGGLASHNVGFTATTGVAADGAQSVLVGPVGTSPAEAFGVTRYNADGSVDTTFGTNGVTTTAFAGTDAVPAAVAVLSDGDILVAGTATTYAASGAAVGSEFAVAEYTAAGSLDPSFGTGGTQLVSFSSTAALSDDVLRAMAVGGGGVIYLGGSSDAAGRANTDLAVAALTSTGAPDATFGTGGKALADVAGGNDAVNALAVQTNGEVVAAGSATVGGVIEVALARFLATGTLDPRFGTKGLVTTKVGGVYDEATSVALQPKGQVVLGGLSASGSGASLSSDFLVQRYTSAGRLDNSFGTRGTAVTPFAGPAAVTQVVLQADGSIVASGRTAATFGASLEVAVARYTTAGKLDTSFAGVGKVVVDLNSGVVASAAVVRAAAAEAVDLGAAFDAFTASEQGVVAVTAGGEILAAGNSGSDTVEAELVAAGVDLAAKVLSSLPESVLSGAKGTVTVTVTESGTTPAKGSVTITVAFSVTAAGTAAATAKAFAERVNLKQGQAHAYKLPFAYPTSLSSGGYYLTATVTDGAGLAADLDVANNVAASPAAVTIAPAFVALAGSGLSAASPVVPGKVAHVTLDVTNDGNVTARGPTTVELFLSPDGTVADGTQVGDPPFTVGLAVGKSRVYHLSFALPDGLAAGTFNLLALLDPTDSLGADDKTGAQAIVGGTVNVN